MGQLLMEDVQIPIEIENIGSCSPLSVNRCILHFTLQFPSSRGNILCCSGYNTSVVVSILFMIVYDSSLPGYHIE